jgi:hypothetical protein
MRSACSLWLGAERGADRVGRRVRGTRGSGAGQAAQGNPKKGSMNTATGWSVGREAIVGGSRVDRWTPGTAFSGARPAEQESWARISRGLAGRFTVTKATCP